MKEKVLSTLGLLLLAVGGSIADSECLFVPVLVTGLGAFLLYRAYL
jgi:hypothetical protein